MKTWADVQLIALRRLLRYTLSHGGLSVVIANCDPEWSTHLLELNGCVIACLPDHQWFWPRLMGITGVGLAWWYAERGGIEFQGFSKQSCIASFCWTYIAFPSSDVVINMWFSIKWNTSVVNELLGHIPVMCSEFSKTDDSLSSDSAAKSFSKFRCKEKKKKFMKILT